MLVVGNNIAIVFTKLNLSKKKRLRINWRKDTNNGVRTGVISAGSRRSSRAKKENAKKITPVLKAKKCKKDLYFFSEMTGSEMRCWPCQSRL